jgi:hypothetical protein
LAQALSVKPAYVVIFALVRDLLTGQMSFLAGSFDVEQSSPAPAASKSWRRAFGLGIAAGALACAFVAAVAFTVGQGRTTYATTGPEASAQVNGVVEPISSGVHDWEWRNLQRYRAGELNDAELGWANLQNAIGDQALMSEVAVWLRSKDGRSQLIQMMADPKFMGQAKETAEHLKKDGELPNLFHMKYYAGPMDEAKDIRPREAAAAFNLPGAASKHGTTSQSTRTSGANMETLADLKKISESAFPLGYFDPLKLGEAEFWGQTNEATIGWLRHAEIKHGRIAMAGFIGYCVHENGITFPWAPFSSGYEGLSAPAVWDALPQSARLQIILTIGFFEFWSESSYILGAEGEKHYMRGGKPGYFPTFKELPHPVPFNLYDPFGFAKKMSAEKKSKRLSMEINNGRLAMLGLFSLISEAKIPGSVPLLKGLIKPYDGEVMAPLL